MLELARLYRRSHFCMKGYFDRHGSARLYADVGRPHNGRLCVFIIIINFFILMQALFVSIRISSFIQ